MPVRVPVLVKVSQVFENTVQNNVAVPVYTEIIKEINTGKEKIVVINNETSQIQQVEVFRDKIVEVSKLVEVFNTNNFIEKQIEIVEIREQREIPIYSTIEKII